MIYDHHLVPVVDALKLHIQNNYISFHMPGHKGGKGIDKDFLSLAGEQIFSIDLTELPGLDDLHLPKECIKHAQELAADAFGAGKTNFLINGTSCGIQASILAACKPGDYLVLPRNAHRSAFSGLILSGAKPAWVSVEFDKDYMIPTHPSLLNFENVLIKYNKEDESNVAAVFCLNPDYQGFCCDIQGVTKLAQAYEVPIIVDEAHGAHFNFHEKLPLTSMKAGADMAIQSGHKTLSVLNQGSMLHIAEKSKISQTDVKQQLTILQTTSPSYPIIASLDAARSQMALRGRELLDDIINLAEQTRTEINNMKGLKCANTDDPCKILISVRELGISGYYAAEFLRDKYKIQVEMADLYNILLLITIGNHKDDFLLINKALYELSKYSSGQTVGLLQNLDDCFLYNEVPYCELSPREAWYSKKKLIPIEESAGCICAEIVAPYPPGIPILCPGEQITQSLVEKLKTINRLKLSVQGTEDSNLHYINVVD